MHFSDKPINFRTPFKTNNSNDRPHFKLLLHNRLCTLEQTFKS